MNNCKCLYCGKEFHTKPSQILKGGGKYCSMLCRNENDKKTKRLDRVCLNCNEEFWIHVCRLTRNPNEGRFCSHKCSSHNEFNSNYKGRDSWIKKEPQPTPRGEKHWAWKGGRCNKSGYIYISKPEHPFCNGDGDIAEHRLVMEAKIGRYLTKNEIVHHINEIRDDNRPENLMIMTPSEHTKHHSAGRVWTGDREKQRQRVIELRKTRFWSSRK